MVGLLIITTVFERNVRISRLQRSREFMNLYLGRCPRLLHFRAFGAPKLSFQQTPKKRPELKRKRLRFKGILSGTQRATVQAWHLRENERDLKNRKRFGWTDDDTTADWPHAAGAYRRIESANKGRGDERHARLERSQSSRLGCNSLPRNMSSRRYPHRPLFSLYKQLDRQRAVQRSIKFAANSTRKF